MATLSTKQLQQLLLDKKIRGYKIHSIARTEMNKVFSAAKKSRSKEKAWMGWNLDHWCKVHQVHLVTEKYFHKERKWRFDWAIPSLKIAIEYEGLMSKKSRHTTVKGFTGDTEKYNAAQGLGWRVLRFTALNYKTLLTELNKIYQNAS